MATMHFPVIYVHRDSMLQHDRPLFEKTGSDLFLPFDASTMCPLPSRADRISLTLSHTPGLELEVRVVELHWPINTGDPRGRSQAWRSIRMAGGSTAGGKQRLPTSMLIPGPF